LELLLRPPSDKGFLDTLLLAQEMLGLIRQQQVPEPSFDSPARAALDSNVLRNLHAFVPLAPRDLRSQPEIWDALELWFESWNETAHLTSEGELVTWEVSPQHMFTCLPTSSLKSLGCRHVACLVTSYTDQCIPPIINMCG
jgi:hypothetical protein